MPVVNNYEYHEDDLDHGPVRKEVTYACMRDEVTG